MFIRQLLLTGFGREILGSLQRLLHFLCVAIDSHGKVFLVLKSFAAAEQKAFPDSHGAKLLGTGHCGSCGGTKFRRHLDELTQGGAAYRPKSNAPRAACPPVAKQPWIRYPPVGASQSIISPAMKTPGIRRNIRRSSSSLQHTPPAEEMASASGRGPSRGMRQPLTSRASASGEDHGPRRCSRIATAAGAETPALAGLRRESRVARAHFCDELRDGKGRLEINGESPD